MSHDCTFDSLGLPPDGVFVLALYHSCHVRAVCTKANFYTTSQEFADRVAGLYKIDAERAARYAAHLAQVAAEKTAAEKAAAAAAQLAALAARIRDGDPAELAAALAAAFPGGVPALLALLHESDAHSSAPEHIVAALSASGGGGAGAGGGASRGGDAKD